MPCALIFQVYIYIYLLELYLGVILCWFSLGCKESFLFFYFYKLNFKTISKNWKNQPIIVKNFHYKRNGFQNCHNSYWFSNFMFMFPRILKKQNKNFKWYQTTHLLFFPFQIQMFALCTNIIFHEYHFAIVEQSIKKRIVLFWSTILAILRNSSHTISVQSCHIFYGQGVRFITVMML